MGRGLFVPVFTSRHGREINALRRPSSVRQWGVFILEGKNMEETVIRFLSVTAFALALATSAQAMSLVPLHQSDGMITQVREDCGTGYHMVNGTCVRTAARRNAARCAVGMHTIGGKCVNN